MTISLDIPKSENIRSTLVVILREFSSIDQKEEYKSRIQQCVASVRGKLAQEVRDVVYAELKHKEKSHDTVNGSHSDLFELGIDAYHQGWRHCAVADIDTTFDESEQRSLIILQTNLIPEKSSFEVLVRRFSFMEGLRLLLPVNAAEVELSSLPDPKWPESAALNLAFSRSKYGGLPNHHLPPFFSSSRESSRKAGSTALRQVNPILPNEIINMIETTSFGTPSPNELVSAPEVLLGELDTIEIFALSPLVDVSSTEALLDAAIKSSKAEQKAVLYPWKPGYRASRGDLYALFRFIERKSGLFSGDPPVFFLTSVADAEHKPPLLTVALTRTPEIIEVIKIEAKYAIRVRRNPKMLYGKLKDNIREYIPNPKSRLVEKIPENREDTKCPVFFLTSAPGPEAVQKFKNEMNQHFWDYEMELYGFTDRMPFSFTEWTGGDSKDGDGSDMLRLMLGSDTNTRASQSLMYGIFVDAQSFLETSSALLCSFESGMPEDIPDFGETHDYDDHRIPNVDDYKEVIAYGRQELGQLVDNWSIIEIGEADIEDCIDNIQLLWREWESREEKEKSFDWYLRDNHRRRRDIEEHNGDEEEEDEDGDEDEDEDY